MVSCASDVLPADVGDRGCDLDLDDVPIAIALSLLAARLEHLARSMKLLSDLTCDLQINVDGSAVLRFRACR